MRLLLLLVPLLLLQLLLLKLVLPGRASGVSQRMCAKEVLLAFKSFDRTEMRANDVAATTDAMPGGEAAG